jgi:hypothetical protein
MSKTLDSLFHLRKHLRIKNHSPGFLKLKVGLSMLKDPAFTDLPDFEEKPRGVNKVKLSLFSRTVSLDYDPDIIPPGLLEELVATEDADRGREIIADLERRIGEPLI